MYQTVDHLPLGLRQYDLRHLLPGFEWFDIVVIDNDIPGTGQFASGLLTILYQNMDYVLLALGSFDTVTRPYTTGPLAILYGTVDYLLPSLWKFASRTSDGLRTV